MSLLELDPVEHRQVGRDPREISPMRALRERLGLSRAALGRLAGVTQSSVQKVEDFDRDHTKAGRHLLETLVTVPIKPWSEFATIIIDGEVARVRLGGDRASGLFAIVDVCDVERIINYSWYGQPASWPVGKFYAVGTVDGKSVPLHRYLVAAKSGQLVDHWNGDTLNCRRSNLRVCTHTQNSSNRRKYSTSSSHYKGVHWAENCGAWRVRITCCGIKYDLGIFVCEEDAAVAYDDAAVILHGRFAHLNFPFRDAREMSDEQRAAAVERLARARAEKVKAS